MEINLDWPLWPRQKQCLTSSANDQLFGGASEGGKSYLLRLIPCLAGMQCEGLQMTLIRKKSADIIKNHLDGNKGLRALLYPLSSKGVVEVTQERIRFPKENTLTFQHCQDVRQFDSAQGNENQLVLIDEAPQIEERLLRAFRGWCRITPDHLARQPKFWQQKLPWILHTGNPTGQSVGYFRKHYVKARPDFSIEEVGGFRRQYVPSKAQDNLSVNLEAHAARLSEIGDDELARALDVGDWDALIGDFLREYDSELHTCPEFMPPAHFIKWRAFDWGKSSPFSVLWFTLSDGEPFTTRCRYQGKWQEKKLWFPLGSIIVYREWHGCNPDKPAEGLGITNKEICEGILARTVEQTTGITVTDNLPFQPRDDELMADVYFKNGVPLTLGNTDRVMGWGRVKDYLRGIDGMPMLYIQEQCIWLHDCIPALERHATKQEDAVWDGWATHNTDALRVGIATRAKPKFKPKETVARSRDPTIMTISSDDLLRQARNRFGEERR